jgi:hypothetical protein
MPSIILKYGNLKTANRSRTSNVATVYTENPHNLNSGAVVDVLGLGGTGYNLSDVAITTITPTGFTYPSPGGDEGSTADTGGRVWTRKTFNALHVMGIDEPDKVMIINPVKQQSDNGKQYRYADAFARMPVINLGVVEAKADRVWIWNFFAGTNNKKLDYSTETDLMVEFVDIEEFLMNWKEMSVYGKELVLNLIEQTARTSNPTIWSA